MLFSSLLLTAAAVVSPVAAEIHKAMGRSELYSVFKRQDSGLGYLPNQTTCGMGTDCASACGDGYIMCPSTDMKIHCFSPLKLQQSCCVSDGNGNSCDPGYYCTMNPANNGTFCCKNGKSLAECASENAVATLVGEVTALPSTTTTTTAASTSATPTTTSSYGGNGTVTTATETDTVTTCTASNGASSGPTNGSTISTPTLSSPTSNPSTIVHSGAAALQVLGSAASVAAAVLLFAFAL